MEGEISDSWALGFRLALQLEKEFEKRSMDHIEVWKITWNYKRWDEWIHD